MKKFAILSGSVDSSKYGLNSDSDEKDQLGFLSLCCLLIDVWLIVLLRIAFINCFNLFFYCAQSYITVCILTELVQLVRCVPFDLSTKSSITEVYKHIEYYSNTCLKNTEIVRCKLVSQLVTLKVYKSLNYLRKFCDF